MDPVRLFLLTLLPLAAAANTISCPAYTSRTGITDGPITLTSSTVTLTNTPSTGTLCTLFTTQNSLDGGKTFYIPVGRSYDGNDWERVAGKYSALEYTCNGDTCTVDLSDWESNTYFVTSYSYTLIPSQTSARFFERASFGASPSMLSLATTEAQMAEWIRDQFDESLTPLTSHRAYFRKRLSPPMLEMGKYGRTGPAACDTHSRWRNFAFTRKDAVISSGWYDRNWPIQPHNATLETKTISTTTKYLWRFAGHIRTMLDTQPQVSSTDAPIEDGTYVVCGVDELPGSVYTTEDERKLYAKFKITISGSCVDVKGGNPDVNIDEGFLVDEVTAGGHVVDFSSVSTGELPSIGHQFPDTVKLLTKTNYYDENTAACDAFPDPEKSDYRTTGWIYSPYYEGFKHPNWDNATLVFMDEPVYAKMPDNTYRLHDRRYTPFENTYENPLSDGGGKMTLDSVYRDINSYNIDDGELLPVDIDDNPRTKSYLSGNEQAIFCSNGPPNVFNEEFCQLSTDPNACVRMGADDEDTVVVVKLTPLALDKINGHGNRTLFQIQGLDFTADTELPCGEGAVSRWVVQDGVTSKSDCDALGANTVETGTYQSFSDLLYYSVGNNDILRDVVMYEKFQGSGCHANDINKYGFAIFDASSTCFLNVHPEDLDVYFVRDEIAIAQGAGGSISWLNSGLTMDDWSDVINNRTLYTYYGRTGDLLILEDMMESLQIYKEQGGKDVTRAPTTSPSEMPSYGPSLSLFPVINPSDTPSVTPSILPSFSSKPSYTDSSSPSESPSISYAPSMSPSTTFPSANPSTSQKPSQLPSNTPSTSAEPSIGPSDPQWPSGAPSMAPSLSGAPSVIPSLSIEPSDSPSTTPSSTPSISSAPSSVPSMSAVPSLEPSQISHVARTFNDNVFHDIANDPDVAYVILESEYHGKTGGVLVCGSKNEIAPDPSEDDYFDYWTRRMDSSPSEGEQKKTVWTRIVLEENDQLAQRIAFALSQIFAISPAFLSYQSLSEAYTYFYDLFVLNGTTTYREVLKNIAYSIKMGMQLSHSGSKSLRYNYDRSNWIRFPDENYAREVMQLETIGLEMLNMDGTVIKDDRGDPIPTYDMEDIITFARSWTGFSIARRRGNYEELDQLQSNWMDPMTLDGQARDWFPKRDLLDGWIGDRYPLCSDLPAKHFLKTGATYKLLGKSSQPRYHFDDPSWDGDETINRMTLNPSSNLHGMLCANDGDSCTYPSVVTITNDIACYGFECDLDTVRVVQVAPNVFYEYVRTPCVHLAFLDNAKTVYAGSTANSFARMCASPSEPVATTTCCTGGSTSPDLLCVYTGDFVSYDTNYERCGSDDSNICDGAIANIGDCGNCCDQKRRYNSARPEYNYFQWTKGGCSYQVKINLDSTVAIVHVPEVASTVVQYVQNSIKNMNYFAVPWPTDPFLGDKLYPNIDNQCGNGTCVEQEDWTCLCNITVSNSMAFSTEPADADTIRDTLKIGAFQPGYFESGYYNSAVVHSSDTSISIFHLASISDYSEDTIFMLLDEFGKETIYLKNLVSMIEIGNDVNDYYTAPLRAPLVMRNPLSFFDLVKPETRDAYYETEAVMDHYMYHPNAAPFVSMQLIQHIGGIANPSPAYINRVSNAFVSGSYISNGITYGTGELSDMKAVVAAILLDQEATSVSLDADPTYGGIKQPIMKVLQFMRGMGYQPTAWDRNIYPKLSSMAARVGQMVHESPDQFSFFLPDYSPPGQMAQASLFAPPAQVLTLSTTISSLEGFFSLVRQGLTSASGGFGSSILGSGSSLSTGDYSNSVGYLSFSPSGTTTAEQVQEIADILTSGRLSTDAITAIATKVDAEASLDTKIRLAQQIIATSPEFHTTNLHNRNGNQRLPTPVQEASPDPYKALVVLQLSGGLDSFNVLMPHTSCSTYKFYRNAREILAYGEEDMLSISNNDADVYDCDKFGVHKKIPILKEIYDDGNGIFMANIGHLHKPVTKYNWATETRTHLFSHKTMEREAQLVDAFQEDGWSTGVVGRMLDKLQEHGMSVSANGIDGKGPMIEGNPSTGRTVDVIPSWGVNTLTRQSLTSQSNDIDGILDIMTYINEETDTASGIFANYWAQNLIDTLNKTDYLSELLGSTTLINDNLFTGSIGKKLDIVSRMILKQDEREVNRDAFFMMMGGFDGHALSNEGLEGNLNVIEQGLRAFYKEMTDQNMVDNVTVVVLSEFGRTISPNSGLGSDHAWGGNAFVFGGEVDGGKLLGKYPERLDDKDLLNVGRGRLIPSIPWESMWYGISNWFGITNSTELEYVLPNNGNMGCQLFTDEDMYVTGNTTVPGCNDRVVGMKLGMFIKEPRYLTGMEQKRICKAAIAKVAKRANVTSRCIVVDQKVIVSIDYNRRVLLDFDDVRYLQTTNATFSVEAEVALDYDDTDDKAGAEYIEDVTSFTADMNQELTGNCTGTCEFQIENVAEVTEFEAQVTEAPSMSPSASSAPSDVPSNQPSDVPSFLPSESTQPSAPPSISTMPSSKPSSSPSESAQLSGAPSISGQPSSQPSASPSMAPQPSPSSAPSESPSQYPSLHPSVSAQPSGSPSSQPSSVPSLQPSGSPSVSVSPSASPSDSPSQSSSPSDSFMPSELPSDNPSISTSPSSRPSDNPSLSPSESPSSMPSESPTMEPSYNNRPSSQPSDSPSATPSESPSAFPSRDCPDLPTIPNNCGLGGIWSPYICQCLCIRPYCPSESGLSCTSTVCTTNYYENVFKDCTYDCPWFKYGNACMRGEDVPTGTSSIYRTKDTCCETEFQSDVAGCRERNGGYTELRYNGRFTMEGIDCSSSSEAIATAASEIAKNTITSICNYVSGLNCDPGDGVVVTKICDQDVQHEVDYSSSSRLRRLSSDNNIVEYTVILIALTEDDVRQKDALLGQYLQGNSLDSIIADILNDITTNGSTQTLSSITAIYYEFINSFIRGLGLYYPAWGGIHSTCLNDGNQPDYMNLQPDLWMTESLLDCCNAYYGWIPSECVIKNAEATIISGSSSASIADSTANLYYPDWTGANTCTTGDAPDYMKRQPEIWMYSTLEDCCKAYYDWEEEDYNACLSLGGGLVPTQVPVDGWYVKWDSLTCVRNCEGASPCGGIRNKWNVLHETKEICCSEHLWWTGHDCTA